MPKSKHKEARQSLNDLLVEADAETYRHSQAMLSLYKKIDRLLGYKEEEA